VLVNLNRTSVTVRLGLALALVLTIGVLAGCGGTGSNGSSSTPTSAFTAQHALTVAMSTLNTSAPDGKLLVAQSAGPINATTTPVWDFLIGSPKTDKIYAVQVQNGTGKFQEYGKAGLSATEWSQVPATTAWKIDSNVAHDKAVAVHTAAKNADYIMGFVTYVPASAKNETAKPMVWIVSFNPKDQGKAPTSTVTVDMNTGAAAFAK
jgi:hypothetical protein